LRSKVLICRTIRIEANPEKTRAPEARGRYLRKMGAIPSSQARRR
jgi:hypothetical protein